MTDVLLVQPPIRDYYLTAKRTVPHGLASIAAALAASGLSATVLDALATSRSRPCARPEAMSYLDSYYGRADRSPFALFHAYRHYGLGFDAIAGAAARSGAWLVGISSLFTAYAEEALQTAAAIRRSCPRATIVVGGHHASALPEAVMASPAVDFVLRGEGELGLPALALALRRGTPLGEVPGLVYRREGGLRVSAPAMAAALDALPLPASALLDQVYYSRRAGPSAVVVTSRGCPLHCSYCSTGASSPLPYRRRDLSSVMSELDRAVGEQGARFVDFEDENLSLDRRWFAELLRRIVDRFGGLGLELRAMNGLLPHTLDDQLISAMRAAGFGALNLSLGSSSPTQLARFQRPDERAAFDAALESAERHGLGAVGYLIIAAPGQEAQSSLADLLYLASRRVLAGLSVYYPSPGSADYEHCRARGLLPSSSALFRSSALPLSDRTTREQACTLLRLGRILNFIKSLLDAGQPLPSPRPLGSDSLASDMDRTQLGTVLLQAFLHDGVIRGVSPDGEVYPHRVSAELCEAFVRGLGGITLRGTA